MLIFRNKKKMKNPNFSIKICLAAAMLTVTGCALATDASSSMIEKNPVVKQVKTTVEKEHLVTDPACTDYLLTKNAEPGLDLVSIVEKHGGRCPGDPQTQPRLFNVLVDQETGQMLSDKDDPVEGTMVPLAPAK